MMLVNMSIQNPLIDQLFLRSIKYIAIRTINIKKQIIPSKMLTGYTIGYVDILPEETIKSQR